jgi:uncharacterized protein (UPF0333 family)
MKMRGDVKLQITMALLLLLLVVVVVVGVLVFDK